MLPTPLILAICIFVCLFATRPHGTASAQDKQKVGHPNRVHFEKQIRPLLLKRCGECHGPEDQTSDLRLDARHGFFKGGSSGPVVVAGNAKASELIRRISIQDDDDDEDERMPPDVARIPDAEIELLTRWINEGAKWPESEYDRKAARDPRRDHWAFQSIQKVKIPTLANSNLNLDPIDRFVGRQLSKKGLRFSPPSDRRTLIRRMSMDLTGLPPTPKQIEEFVNDKNPDAIAKLVDRLLASPRYGERWAQHWLDLVRYADTHGFEVNTPRENAWHYRDYVIRSFNDDKPYDQFVIEQLAGDVLDADEATGFLVAAAVLLPGQIGKDDISKRQARQDELDEIIIGTSATFMGLTVGCARCHDHKFDPISQRDYYTLQAFFSGVHYGDRPIQNQKQKQRQAKARDIAARIRRLEKELRPFEPRTFSGRTRVIDERDKRFTQILHKEDSTGNYPVGSQMGYQDDQGSASRLANISRGYTFWGKPAPGKDLLAYHPAVNGRFHLWISWSALKGDVHSRDARYILDRDGDLKTTDDQTEIAKVDQRFAVGPPESLAEPKAIWSGLKAVGVIQLDERSKIVLRNGETGKGTSADLIVLQEVADPSRSKVSQSGKRVPQRLPHLRAPVNARENVEHFESVSAKFVRLTILETTNNNRYEPCIDELEVYTEKSPYKNIALASNGAIATSSGNYSETGKHQLKHVNDGIYGNDRSWISNQKGGGWVQIELASPSSIDRVVWGRDRNRKYADRLPIRYRVEVSVDGKNWQTVSDHQDRQPFGTPFSFAHSIGQRKLDPKTVSDLKGRIAELANLRIQKRTLENPQMAFAGVFRKPHATFLLRRGDPEQKLDRLAPATPGIFQGIELSETVPEQHRRIQLAKWIASPKNPLTARVMVNRIWQFHFGRGLVATPSDFGLNGQPPSHPELLDWLAQELINSGWSVKHIHRLILNSKTFQQSSIKPARIANRDDQWLWRFPSRRIEAEAVRDSMLFVSGELNLKMGGPGFDFFKSRGGLNGFPPKEQFNTNGLRRMIYAHKIRMEKTPVFGAFDCPDAGQPMPQRGQSITAIQALNLFNSQFVIERANRFADRVKRERPDDLEAQVEWAFHLALGREPSRAEATQAVKTCRQHGLETLCRVLFNTNEFLFIQ